MVLWSQGTRLLLSALRFLFFGCVHDIWTFPGQGSNLPHSSNLMHFSDHARSLILCATRELLFCHFFSFLSFLFVFVGPHLWPMEVPRLGVELELQLLAYTTATAVPDPSSVCDLHCSLWQHWILNPLSGARYQTYVLMATSQVCYCWATTGTPCSVFFFFFVQAFSVLAERLELYGMNFFFFF